MKTSKPWTTEPISPTCQVWMHGRTECGRATVYAYPAHGGGWMALCGSHGHKHRNSKGTELAVDLIAKGEKWE